MIEITYEMIIMATVILISLISVSVWPYILYQLLDSIRGHGLVG